MRSEVQVLLDPPNLHFIFRVSGTAALLIGKRQDTLLLHGIAGAVLGSRPRDQQSWHILLMSLIAGRRVLLMQERLGP